MINGAEQAGQLRENLANLEYQGIELLNIQNLPDLDIMWFFLAGHRPGFQPRNALTVSIDSLRQLSACHQGIKVLWKKATKELDPNTDCPKQVSSLRHKAAEANTKMLHFQISATDSSPAVLLMEKLQFPLHWFFLLKFPKLRSYRALVGTPLPGEMWASKWAAPEPVAENRFGDITHGAQTGTKRLLWQFRIPAEKVGAWRAAA